MLCRQLLAPTCLVHADATPATPPNAASDARPLPTSGSGPEPHQSSITPPQLRARVSPSLDQAVQAAAAEAVQEHERLQQDPYLRFMEGFASEPVTDRMQEIMVGTCCRHFITSSRPAASPSSDAAPGTTAPLLQPCPVPPAFQTSTVTSPHAVAGLAAFIGHQ